MHSEPAAQEQRDCTTAVLTNFVMVCSASSVNPPWLFVALPLSALWKNAGKTSHVHVGPLHDLHGLGGGASGGMGG